MEKCKLWNFFEVHDFFVSELHTIVCKARFTGRNRPEVDSLIPWKIRAAMSFWHMIGAHRTHRTHADVSRESVERIAFVNSVSCQALHRFWMCARTGFLLELQKNPDWHHWQARHRSQHKHTANRPCKLRVDCVLYIWIYKATGWKLSFWNLNFESHTNKETGTSHDQLSARSCGTPPPFSWHTKSASSAFDPQNFLQRKRCSFEEIFKLIS